MSRHNFRRKIRNLDYMQRFEVAHITFEVDEKEKTFALIAGKAMQEKDRKPLFSGVITEEMGTQLRILGNEIEEMTLRGQDE